MLANKTFILQANTDGLAAPATTMRFGPATNPMTATYDGPNIQFGHAIASSISDTAFTMLYHAVTAEGELVAGQADGTLSDLGDQMEMRLQWRWLTGAGSGESVWQADARTDQPQPD